MRFAAVREDVLQCLIAYQRILSVENEEVFHQLHIRHQDDGSAGRRSCTCKPGSPMRCRISSAAVRPSQSHVLEAVVVQQRGESLDRRRVELLQQTTRVVPHGAYVLVLSRVCYALPFPLVDYVIRHKLFLWNPSIVFVDTVHAWITAYADISNWCLTKSEEPDGFDENARLVGCVVFEPHEPEVFSRKNLQPVLDVDAVQAHRETHLREKRK